jgi:hypothetical protein
MHQQQAVYSLLRPGTWQSARRRGRREGQVWRADRQRAPRPERQALVLGVGRQRRPPVVAAAGAVVALAAAAAAARAWRRRRRADDGGRGVKGAQERGWVQGVVGARDPPRSSVPGGRAPAPRTRTPGPAHLAGWRRRLRTAASARAPPAARRPPPAAGRRCETRPAGRRRGLRRAGGGELTLWAGRGGPQRGVAPPRGSRPRAWSRSTTQHLCQPVQRPRPGTTRPPAGTLLTNRPSKW